MIFNSNILSWLSRQQSLEVNLDLSKFMLRNNPKGKTSKRVAISLYLWVQNLRYHSCPLLADPIFILNLTTVECARVEWHYLSLFWEKWCFGCKVWIGITERLTETYSGVWKEIPQQLRLERICMHFQTRLSFQSSAKETYWKQRSQNFGSEINQKHKMAKLRPWP